MAVPRQPATDDEQRSTVTLAHIAARVGVTAATVSNAYNRPEKLSPQLREQIFAVAKELHYAGPHPVGRSLSRGKTGAIGWIIPTSLSHAVTDPALLPFLQGMAEELRRARVGLLTLPSSSDDAPDVSVVRNALVDGFIVTFARDDPFLEAALARNVPLVVVEQPRIDGIAGVFIEQNNGARQASEHLTSLGHRNFGILTLRSGHDDFTGPLTPQRQSAISYEVTADRLNGYLNALAEAGIDPDAIPIYEPRSTRDGGREGALWLLSQQPRPTALLAMSDVLAFGAIDAANELGIRVPEDLSIVGFDGIDSAATMDPPLTTVEQPLREKGVLAARMLLSPEHFESNTMTLPTKLIVRSTTLAIR